LSDTEHALFTASLADLADVHSTSNDRVNWERISVSVRVREARAWICGWYVSLGLGRSMTCIFFVSFSVFDFISVNGKCNTYRSASSPPNLGGGAFFALLRLVLHTQVGIPSMRCFVCVSVSPVFIPLLSIIFVLY
jgi:hypothetical protein